MWRASRCSWPWWPPTWCVVLPSRSYAPNTGVVLSPETGAGLPGRSNDIARSGAMWLGGVVVWGAISYWILRQRNSDDT